MPAWQPGRYFGLKVVNVAPGNAALGLPGLFATYQLFDANTGAPLALIDGGEITARRTAAASALAASRLARPGRAAPADRGRGTRGQPAGAGVPRGARDRRGDGVEPRRRLRRAPGRARWRPRATRRAPSTDLAAAAAAPTSSAAPRWPPSR